MVTAGHLAGFPVWTSVIKSASPNVLTLLLMHIFISFIDLGGTVAFSKLGTHFVSLPSKAKDDSFCLFMPSVVLYSCDHYL